MDFDVRLIVRVGCDYYYYYHHHNNYRYHYYFTQFAVIIHENSIKDLKILKWILNIKVKFSRYRPGLAQRVGRGIALLFHDRGTRRG